MQRPNYAAVKDVKIKLSKEVFVSGMGQRLNCVEMKDVQTRLIKEECALGMGQRSNYAAN